MSYMSAIMAILTHGDGAQLSLYDALYQGVRLQINRGCGFIQYQDLATSAHGSYKGH
jgi:hypothetical protein